MDVQEMRGRPVGLLLSGGLSSMAVALWLRDSGADLTCFVADIGQGPSESVPALVEALGDHGFKAVAVDLATEMAEAGMQLIRYQARHDGGYWNTTGMSRQVLAAGLVPQLRAAGCTVLAHGCVGGGNDERRFARYTAAYAPDLQVYAPWTDPAARHRYPDRAAMAAQLAAEGLPLDPGSSASRSTDANVAGVSHEDAALEDLGTPPTVIRPLAGRWPTEAPDRPRPVTVRVEQGVLVALDGVAGPPLDLLRRANAVAADNGVWMRDVVENRVNGTKCRGVYEAPGAELLGVAIAEVHRATVADRGYRLLESLAAFLGQQVYEGRWAESATAAARAGLDVLTDAATATVELVLYKGSLTVQAVRDYPAEADAIRQARFGAGGHHWELVGT